MAKVKHRQVLTHLCIGDAICRYVQKIMASKYEIIQINLVGN